jgi:hypothetical protein
VSASENNILQVGFVIRLSSKKIFSEAVLLTISVKSN